MTHPLDHILRYQTTLRSDMTTVANVTLKVRVNGGAATTYTNVSTPAIAALADCAFAFALEIPASTYADGDRVERVWFYSGTAYATGSTVIEKVSADGAYYTTARGTKLDQLDVAVSTRSTLTAAGVWDALLTSITTASSIGKLVKDYLDAAISSRLASSGYTTPPTAAANASAVWEEPLSGHTTAGTAGKTLSTAGSAADPLTNAVPGSYASGTAGYILGHVIPGQDASIASPLALDLELTIVKGDDYNASDSRSIDFNEPNASWPTLTSATVKFGYQEIVNGVLTGSVTELAMTVVTGTGSSKVVRLELSAAQSAVFSNGRKRYEFDVQATLATSSRKVTLARGFVTVLPSFVA